MVNLPRTLLLVLGDCALDTALEPTREPACEAAKEPIRDSTGVLEAVPSLDVLGLTYRLLLATELVSVLTGLLTLVMPVMA